MQITGETLERAMAVLQGHAGEPLPEDGHAAESDRALPDVEPDASDSGQPPEDGQSPDEDQPPQRHRHLRGL
ncbi:hypothetical protein AB0G35_26150 [Streptomyces sp. NPDC021749]|uniref:hypothetical protein n=1 Tax=Streptomyces sp. NPDC021749 TaxID=3154905 RepID=UPI0033EC47F6